MRNKIPKIRKNIAISNDFVGVCDVKPAKHGDIFRFLRTTPGILPPVEQLPGCSRHSSSESANSTVDTYNSDTANKNNNNNSSGSSIKNTENNNITKDASSGAELKKVKKPKAKASKQKKLPTQQKSKQDPKPNVQPRQQYINARELYEWKRGKKSQKYSIGALQLNIASL